VSSPRRGPIPRRVVRYRLISDELGPYIVFSLDVVVLPEDVPPHKLPDGIQLHWTRLECRFAPGAAATSSEELRGFFQEFAETMRWELHQEA